VSYTIEDIKRALNASHSDITPGGIVSSGALKGNSGAVDYTVHLGWDLMLAHLCDRSWGAFNVSLLRHIRMQQTKGIDIGPILDSAQLEDNHWSWLIKSLHYRGDCYKWFFLVAEKYPQAACLIYHPKDSVTGVGQIFYVEYIAVAPWNRENVLAPRVFRGVGQSILNHVLTYARDDLKLSSGFSLHSLPKAVPFYQKLGMKHIPEHDKQGLKFFEWVDQ
jgi:hypothetical protein